MGKHSKCEKHEERVYKDPNGMLRCFYCNKPLAKPTKK